MRCPNCKGDLERMKCKPCSIDWRGSVYDTRWWVCSDCGIGFTRVGEFQFCPACYHKRQLAEIEYWNLKRGEAKSIADDIVARVLGK